MKTVIGQLPSLPFPYRIQRIHPTNPMARLQAFTQLFKSFFRIDLIGWMIDPVSRGPEAFLIPRGLGLGGGVSHLGPTPNQKEKM